ncbi:MAG: single-stranded DNA-binding protein [Metallosphaera yellowstonensis]|jgi:Single-stranded DNA-binding replication protein A (RPA), large (70 kD) subunit and related ssDNA-binding proteins|uniref:OB-fold nucleic acid binding protein n=1 Tax=Metallosphaera yellowstonensis MK1 TaxID=671065 RepID=H2C360_9CREN|nr:single-stranded DNA-binding protein [Metallosphaera yellowstonensis]EHP70681.1 OB-fold nucleic acid binding protein [Metallosphaera yellowstonensis MK1]
MEEKIGNLKGGMENIEVTARVLEVGEQKVVQTKNGPRTIREVMVGDDTGRVKLTLWGSQGDTVKEGQVIKVENAWTTVFKGQVQLNAGSRSKISEASEASVPEADQVPETSPTDDSPPQRRGFRGRGRRNYGGGGYGNFGGGYRRRPREEGEEEE